MVTTTPNGIATDPHNRATLSGITWEMYEQILEQTERSGRRCVLNYDGGELEIEMPSKLHELIKKFLAAILEVYLFDKATRFVPAGQTTFRRRMLDKGLEADDTTSPGDAEPPAPDLAVEVEVATPLLAKLPIYAAVGVTEIWHVEVKNGQVRCRIMRLIDGRYAERPASELLPTFTPALLETWVRRRLADWHFDAVTAFRAWLATA